MNTNLTTELAIPISLAQCINDVHRDMHEWLREASESEALYLVRLRQYTDAINHARIALERINDIQEQVLEICYTNLPNATLDELKRELNL